MMPEPQGMVHSGTAVAASGWSGATIYPFVGVRTLPRPDAHSDVSDGQTDWEVPIAKAALDVIAAYRHLHEVVPEALPPRVVRSFRVVCDSLCSTVVAMDELTASSWWHEPA